MAKLASLASRVDALNVAPARPLHSRGDDVDRSYHTQAWRKTAKRIVARDRGICHVCGKSGANTAHHLIEKRDGGTDDDRNLRAVHGACHNSAHPHRAA